MSIKFSYKNLIDNLAGDQWSPLRYNLFALLWLLYQRFKAVEKVARILHFASGYGCFINRLFVESVALAPNGVYVIRVFVG
jgi:hypothetical protein